MSSDFRQAQRPRSVLVVFNDVGGGLDELEEHALAAQGELRVARRWWDGTGHGHNGTVVTIIVRWGERSSFWVQVPLCSGKNTFRVDETHIVPGRTLPDAACRRGSIPLRLVLLSPHITIQHLLLSICCVPGVKRIPLLVRSATALSKSSTHSLLERVSVCVGSGCDFYGRCVSV